MNDMMPDQPTQPHTPQGRQWNNLRFFFWSFYFIGTGLFIFYMDYNDWWIARKVNEFIPAAGAGYKLEVIVLWIISALIFSPVFLLIDKFITGKRDQLEDTNAYMPAPDQLEFAFDFFGVVNMVTLDKYFIKVNAGLQVIIFPLDRFCNFYLTKGNRDSQMLYLSYKDQNEKLKNIPLIAESNDAQLKRLIAELETRFPGKSLLHLSKGEAFKTMKVVNPLIIQILFLVGVVLVGIWIWYAFIR